MENVKIFEGLGGRAIFCILPLSGNPDRNSVVKLKTFLVDDEQKALDTLSNALTTFFDNVDICGTASNVQDAYDGILAKQPQLVFLDVEMGAESGFQLLEKFAEINFEVAFVTGHEEFALKAIKFSALDYIIKPAGISELKTLLQKVETTAASTPRNRRVKQMFGNFGTTSKGEQKIAIATTHGYEFIKVSHILYILSIEGYCEFFLAGNKKILSSKSLRFYDSLLTEYGFYRVHHATLINLAYVQAFYKKSGGIIKMENGEEFDVARSRKDQLLNLLSLR